MPYIKTLVPALDRRPGRCAALVEMIFHVRHAYAGDEEMTLFWTTFNSHAVIPGWSSSRLPWLASG